MNMYDYKWASSEENLSSGFPTNRDSNLSPQLQRLARKNVISLVSSLDMILSKNELEFRESHVSPGKTKVKQGEFIEFISQDEGLF